MKGKCFLMGVFCLALLTLTGRAEAMIIIHEFLADPPEGNAGDANRDGTRSTTQDEFVELFNASADTVDLDGWSLSDSASLRHAFTGRTPLLPGGLFVVFGGGDPDLPGVSWQTASSGGLSLNNSGDMIRLYDPEGVLADSVTFGSEGGKNESLVRSPETEAGGFVLHSQLKEGLAYSPGTFAVYEPGSVQNPDEGDEPVNEHPDLPLVPGDDAPIGGAPVPEPLTLLSFGAGVAGLSFFRRK